MPVSPSTFHLIRLLCFLFLISLTPVATRPAQASLPTVAIQPLGKVKAAYIEQAKLAIEQRYAVEVVVLSERDLPYDAYYRPRDRYRAEKLLEWLDLNTATRFTKIIGLTESDISTTKDDIYDWGIFGLGDLVARPCVVSTFRLGRKVTRAKLLERLGKVVGHEVGHTFGLVHCETAGCLMQDAGGKVATVDAESGQLCESCRQQVSTRVLAKPADSVSAPN